MGGSLFGSGGSSRLDVNPDSVPKPFRQLRGPLSDLFLMLLGYKPKSGRTRTTDELMGGVPDYEGETTAPMTKAEAAALKQLQRSTGPGTARNRLLEQTLRGKFLGKGNPFLQQAIEAAQRPVTQRYEEILGRTLPGQFTAAGHTVQPGQSSPFDMAAALQARGLAQELGDISSQMSFGAYESERGRQQQAIPLSQQEVQTTIQNLQAQALPRAIQQHGLDTGLALFQKQTQDLLSVLSLIAGMPMTPQSAVVSKGGTPGVFPQLMGALTGGALAAGGLGYSPFSGGGGGMPFGSGYGTPGGNFIPYLQ